MLLAEAELELVPKSIRGHPAVSMSAKKRGKRSGQILLDASLHHSAMQRLDDWEGRGRPDIAHSFLVLCLDSIANVEGELRVLVHTRNNELIEVDPTTRIPKNYNRFVGLMEDLFVKGAVPNKENPLLTMRGGATIEDVIRGTGVESVLALSVDGRRMELDELFGELGGDVLCVVGGFPKGDFKGKVYELCTHKVSIHGETLKVWTVTSEILTSYRRARLSGD